MASSQSPAGNVDLFDLYFQRADLDRDGRISGAEAVTFFLGSGLPKPVLAQIWALANPRQADFLGRAEFYNALKLVTVAQSNRQLTPDIVKAALYTAAAAKIPAPKINVAAAPQPLHGSAPAAPPRPPLPTPTTVSQPMQGFPRGVVAAGPRPPVPNTVPRPQTLTPNMSNDWSAGSTVNAPTGTSMQVQNKGVTSSMGLEGFGLTTPSLPSTSQPNSGSKSLGSLIKDTKTANVSGNGFASDSFFGGDAFSATPVQPKQDASTSAVSARSLPAAPALVPNSSVRPNTLTSVQRPPMTPIPVAQFQPGQSVVSPAPAPAPPSIPGVAPGTGQSQVSWPKMTQTDALKYREVFVKVDTDKDGKITGEQARNLFLSWRLPRDVLKQVWDLSDQDNDSMLSLREFCIALYFMERYREGRPIPATLPSNVIFDVSSFPQPTTNASNAAWSASSIPPAPPKQQQQQQRQQQQQQQQQQRHHQQQQQQRHHQQQQQQRHHQQQHAGGFQQQAIPGPGARKAAPAMESKQKIAYFSAKMQELVLYKSRCGNRLNEIMERTSADKKEVESLAKKYEEKYKETGDIASKLTIEEATLRDMQEKKMELHQAIVQLEQGGSTDLQERADKVQSDLDELAKALNDRCNKYGVRGKPLASVELPSGWQPGIQDGAVDWDEDWDKFEDEGFTFVKELTVDVQNMMAPSKEKLVLSQKIELSTVESPKATSSSNGDVTLHKPDIVDERVLENGSYTKTEIFGKSNPSSPMGPNSPMGASSYVGSPSGDLSYANFDKTFGSDSSPRDRESQSDEKGFDDPAWGAYDMNDDVDSVWGFNASSSTIKDTDHERNNDFLFGSEDFGLNPIRTGSTQTSSVPQNNRTFTFDDSVPSTPLYNTGNSPTGSSGPSFDNFSRFDSFRSYDSGFPTNDSSSFARFDSMRSTSDFDQSHRGFPPLDEPDPFGSSGPFKSSFDTETPRKSSDGWNAF